MAPHVNKIVMRVAGALSFFFDPVYFRFTLALWPMPARLNFVKTGAYQKTVKL